MSNLVIFCDDAERAERIACDVPDIVARHPARVLLLVGNADAEDAQISASVLVRDHANHSLSEQVTLCASGSRIHQLPFVVRNLQVGDLPTNLWWASREPAPLSGMLLHELAEHAQQVIYDSVGWPDPIRAVAVTAPWIEQFERVDGQGRWRVVCASRTTVVDCRVSGNGFSGIVVNAGSNSIIRGNHCSGNGTGILEVASSDSHVIVDNVCVGNTTGISGDGAGNAFFDNYAAYNTTNYSSIPSVTSQAASNERGDNLTP